MFDYGTKPTIAIQNNSTLDLGYNLSNIVADLQVQLDRDFLPAWGRTATLSLIQPGSSMPVGSWHLLIVDSADEPGAEGYHELTDDGYPIMYVGVKDTLSAGDKVSTTISHEVLEGVIDPAINAEVDDPNGVTWAAEVCDAVETEEYMGPNQTPLSNFQTPAWFMGFVKQGQAKFDFLNVCTRPFEIRKGGYMSIKKHGKWTQIFGSRESKIQHSKRVRRRFRLRQKGGRYQHKDHQMATKKVFQTIFDSYVF